MDIDYLTQQRNLWNTFSPGWKKWDLFVMQWLRPVGEALINSVNLKEDDIVLDVATGTGEPGLSAAVRLKNGKVIGTDVSEEMIKIAQFHAKSKGIKNYQAQISPASSLPFPDNAFSVILCRFGVMYFANPESDIKELVRLLKPGGRIALSAWAEPEKNPWATTSGKTVQEILKLPSPDSQAPGIFRQSKQGSLSMLFQHAGLKEIEEIEVTGELVFNSPEHYWEYTMDVVAPVAVALSKLDSGIKEQIKNAVLTKTKAWEKHQHVIFPWSSWVITGIKN